MSLKFSFMVSENCDKCGEAMTPERPGMTLSAYSQESGRMWVWVHVDELEKGLVKVKKEITKYKETPCCEALS
jgi:hypothetical protein